MKLLENESQCWSAGNEMAWTADTLLQTLSFSSNTPILAGSLAAHAVTTTIHASSAVVAYTYAKAKVKGMWASTTPKHDILEISWVI